MVTHPTRVEASSDQRPHSITGPKMQQRLWRHLGPRNDATLVGPRIQGAVGGGGQNNALPRQAVLEAIAELKVSMDGVGDAFSRFATRPATLGGWGLNDIFARHLDHGSNHLTWLRGALGSATALAEVASEVGDSSTEVGLLRMSGPRLQAVLFGNLLLATWFDFLQFADAVSRHCLMCSSEKMFVVLHRVKGLMEPRLTELASLDPERVEAAATAMPELMGELTREFDALHRDTRATMEADGKVMAAVQVWEMLTLVSTLKMSLPRLPPAAPATLGAGLVMSSGGVMAGSRIVVSTEWVEMMRRLVQAGIISVPVISAAVRIHSGQVLMAQAHQDLPKGVRDALGDSPEVRGMRVTDKAGAGMSEAPKHHVMPNEHREWFEQRGFTGDLDIDNFCVRLERAHHEAIHGGGSWRLGRTWPGEWNRMIMETLRDAEAEAGRRLTRNTILRIVGENMNRYYIPMNFTPGRR
ncbi:TIGR02269 family lipoprotein [Myxococcus qinghaiensis]|uniref:TIGR02269 family lipoprotein n=1 Tax=Myxococcus qinghaiensis TaxID=2906758 RepID=UPI0020A8386E|nr:TIGR02269 family lipoprotein [Myxococcus qinghaiensis]